MPSMSSIEHAIDLMESVTVKPNSRYRSFENGLSLIKSPRPSDLKLRIESPSLCFVFQGRIGCHGDMDSLSILENEPRLILNAFPYDLTAIPRNRNRPCIAALVALDITKLSELKHQLSQSYPSADEGPGTVQSQTDNDDIAQTLCRLVAISDSPIAQEFLDPLIMMELHFHLLRSRHCQALFEFPHEAVDHKQIARAILIMKSDLSRQLNMPSIASAIGMSPSSFHAHFKLQTGLSPLQYYKSLKLERARAWLLKGSRSITNIAYSLGYSSPNQFSRDYSAKYGIAPRLEQLKSKKPKYSE